MRAGKSYFCYKQNRFEVVYRSPNSDETNNEKLLELLSQIRDKVKISNVCLLYTSDAADE